MKIAPNKSSPKNGNRCLKRGLGVLALIALVIAVPTWANDETAPSSEIEGLNALLLEVMQNADELGFEGRYDRLDPELRRIFDFPFMAKTSIGRAWNDLTPEQQQAYSDAFADLSVATFANRFSGYSGENFQVTGQAPGRSGTVMVQNRLIKSDGEPVEINYLTREADGQWHVVDVLLDGRISELATKRSEYSAVLKNHGIDHLIDSLSQKASQLASQ
ncbi:MAG: ABC transporter substrate-binding protein [Pseudomonadota bacterium]